MKNGFKNRARQYTGVRRSGLDMIRIARTAQKGKFSHLATTAGFIAKPQIFILLLDCTNHPSQNTNQTR